MGYMIFGLDRAQPENDIYLSGSWTMRKNIKYLSKKKFNKEKPSSHHAF